jgi:hypothetical protein
MDAYYDLAARFPCHHAYGRGFRIGDREAAYMQAALWRASYPEAFLTAIDDLT